MLRTIIIDDEIPVRETLKTLLDKACPQVSVIGEADGVATGIRIIREKTPDLVLLDIRMSDGTGFDLLNSFDNILFKVIFVTAYEEYAVRAFAFSAIDYILKPVNPEKLAEAVQRAEKVTRSDFSIQLAALRENVENPGKTNKKIIFKNLESIFLFDVDDLVHLTSEGSYTTIETMDSQRILVSRNLKEYDNLLSGSGFLRVHRSHLINLRHVRRFDKQDGGYVVMSNGCQVPVSGSGRSRLLELFEEMTGL
ncbi:MAG: response regulator transcription factor [Bacteroidales bacterium]|nr:response regulator transcription factor [Bacteroidales bacterium]